jgi:hypothetical protein
MRASLTLVRCPKKKHQPDARLLRENAGLGGNSGTAAVSETDPGRCLLYLQSLRVGVNHGGQWRRGENKTCEEANERH